MESVSQCRADSSPRHGFCNGLSPSSRLGQDWSSLAPAEPVHEPQSWLGFASPSPKMTWLIASLQRCSSSSHKGGCLGLGSLQLLDIFWGPPQTSGNVRDGRGFFFLFTGEALGRGGTILRSYTALVVKVEARASCLRESRAFSTGSFLGLGMSCAPNVAPSPFVGRGCFPETRAGRLCAKSE